MAGYINLADHVQHFGGRLDNHRQYHRNYCTQKGRNVYALHAIDQSNKR